MPNAPESTDSTTAPPEPATAVAAGSEPTAAVLVDLRGRIVDWYAANKRDLPMRAESVSPWGTLVGEVMSQQTPMPRVQPFWSRWMERWPTPQALADASPADVLVEWGSLGYPSRALRLRDCAIAIANRPGGRVPADYEELLSLPGIGPYTASALVSFQFHGRIAVLDTNIRRVLVRTLLGIERPASSAPTAAERAIADRMLPADGAECATWNVAVMEFGALVCTQRSPACEECPVADLCRWTAAGRPASGTRTRAQAWTGTDRQARGRVMALLRDRHAGSASADPSGASRAEALAAATLPGADPEQAPRVLAGLLADGLVVEGAAGRLSLPSA